MNHNPPVRAYILAGGKSSRFGSDKARVVIEGIPNLCYLAHRLEKLQLPTTVVSQSHSDYSDLGLRVIPDFEPGAGPLAGTITALRDAKSHHVPWSLILTCDLLWHNDTWIHRLLTAIQSPISPFQPTAFVRLFRSESFSPFPGLYHVDSWPHAQESWNRGVRSMRGWLQGNRLHYGVERSEGGDSIGPHSSSNVLPIDYVPVSAEDLPGSFNTSDELRTLRHRTGDHQ
ncbi:MAG: molybdenum cofactor guanylyltransferase [Planctomycetes bacterium]|nr:molybdenum cofactor guanylyltransferase [Planctomycetota bacterium]